MWYCVNANPNRYKHLMKENTDNYGEKCKGERRRKDMYQLAHASSIKIYEGSILIADYGIAKEIASVRKL